MYYVRFGTGAAPAPGSLGAFLLAISFFYPGSSLVPNFLLSINPSLFLEYDRGVVGCGRLGVEAINRYHDGLYAILLRSASREVHENICHHTRAISMKT